MAATVGDIVINVTADIGPLIRETSRAKAALSGFEAATQRISSGMKAFGSSAMKVGGIMTGVTAAIGVAAGAALAFTKNASEIGDQISNSAKAAGVSTGYYQEMAFAITQVSDATQDDLDKALVKLTKTLGEAGQGSKSAIKAFEAIGISQDQIASGSVTTQQAFDTLIAKLNDTTDPALAAAIASGVLGKAGARMGAQLAGAGDEVKGLRDKARDLGVVMSDDAVQAAENFGDKWQQVTTQFDALKMKIANVLLPVLVNDLIPAIQDKVIPALGMIVEKIGDVIGWFQGLPAPVQEAAGAIALAFAAGGPVLVAIGAVSMAMGALVAATGPIGLMIAAAAILAAAWIKWGDDFKVAVGGAIDYVSGKIDAIVALFQTVIDKAKAVGTAITEAFSKNPGQFTNGAPDLLSVMPIGEPTDAGGTGTDAANGMIDGFQNQVAQRMPDIDAAINSIPARARELLQIQSPSRVFAEIGGYVGEGMAQDIQDSAAMVHSAVGVMTNSAVTSTGGMVDSILSSLGTLFQGSKEWAIAQAAINIGRGLSEAISLPFPASVAAFAKVAAMGAQAMRSIKGARRGSDGGGVSAAASTPSAPAQPTTTMNFSIVNDPFGISEKVARQIIDQLNATSRNGGRFVGVLS